MPIAANHVVTGATGLVGSAIILELLRRDPQAQVFALVRPQALGADARLREALLQAARHLDLGGSLDGDIHERCHALPGDVEQPRCGVLSRPLPAGAELWHCAASLLFHDRFKEQVTRTNVGGTANAIALAQMLEVATYNQISTAYVAGKRSGEILEAPVDADVTDLADADAVNNFYERSKAIAEGMVLASGLRSRILRPSVVIGHSRTRQALTFNGFYGFVRGVYKFRQLMERTQRQLMDTLEVKMLADADGIIDLIPVDFVASDAVGLSLGAAEPGIYHLAAVAQPATRRVIEVIFDAVGLRRPRFVDREDELTWVDRKLHQAITVYSAYLFGAKRFDRARTDGALARPAGAGYRLDDDELFRLADAYLEAELRTRAPLPETV